MKQSVNTGAPDIIGKDGNRNPDLLGKNKMNVESVCRLRTQLKMSCRGCQFNDTRVCDAYSMKEVRNE